MSKKLDRELQKIVDAQGGIDYATHPGYTKQMKALFAKKEIRKEDYAGKLSEEEIQCLNAYMYNGEYNLTGKEKTKFRYQMYHIAPEIFGPMLEEQIHAILPAAISKYARDYSSMGTTLNYSQDTGIPQEVVKAYLDAIPTPPGREYMKQFKALECRVMARVYEAATDGDMAAAKLFLTVTGAIEQTPRTQTVHNTQNNFIQLNGNILSQNTIEQLPEAQQVKVWELINKSLPQKQLNKPKAALNGTNKENGTYN